MQALGCLMSHSEQALLVWELASRHMARVGIFGSSEKNHQGDIQLNLSRSLSAVLTTILAT